MLVSLHGKTVFITGGLRGIGLAVTELMAKSGATVIATYFSNDESARSKISALQNENLNVIGCKLDIRNGSQVTETIEALESSGRTFDVLVNNAGIVNDQLLIAMDDDAWRDVIDTNLSGVFFVTRAIAKQMIRSRSGVIINISSVAASRPGRGQVNYASSKGGIEAMTKALAVELAPKKIRVNAIAPGVIATEMSRDVRDAAGDQILNTILLKRFGEPSDVANLAVFLASDLASYITGEIIHIDGGLKL